MYIFVPEKHIVNKNIKIMSRRDYIPENKDVFMGWAGNFMNRFGAGVPQEQLRINNYELREGVIVNEGRTTMNYEL